VGERVETYGYPFSIVVPDQTFSDYKSVTFSPVFLRGYVTLYLSGHQLPVQRVQGVCSGRNRDHGREKLRRQSLAVGCPCRC
jgi:hypothetical protein